VPSQGRPAHYDRERARSGAVRSLATGESPAWSAIPTERPSHRLSLEASLGQARVVPLDVYRIRSNRTDVLVTADLPGVKPSEVSFAVDPGQVTISSQIDPAADDDGDPLWQLCREMRGGRYNQTLEIPGGLLVDHWAATFEDGVLRLSIPRAGRH
jgi:HSP20 family molecular chaperone IbpA